MKLAIQVMEDDNGRIDISVYPPGERTASELVGVLTLASHIIMSKYNPAAELPRKTMPPLDQIMHAFANEMRAQGLEPDMSQPRWRNAFRRRVAAEMGVPVELLPEAYGAAEKAGEMPSDEDEPKPNGTPKLRGL